MTDEGDQMPETMSATERAEAILTDYCKTGCSGTAVAALIAGGLIEADEGFDVTAGMDQLGTLLNQHADMVVAYRARLSQEGSDLDSDLADTLASRLAMHLMHGLFTPEQPEHPFAMLFRQPPEES
jgi:hypothetical protein